MAYFILLISLLTSCYPPRIIYSIEETQFSCLKDSVGVRLIKGSTVTTGGMSLFLNLYLEVSNNTKDSIFIDQNSTLDLRTNTSILKYEISSDSLAYQLGKNDKKQFCLSFQTTDFEYVTYNTIDTGHKLCLVLDLRNGKGEKIDKCVILKPTGTKRMKYEEPPF